MQQGADFYSPLPNEMAAWKVLNVFKLSLCSAVIWMHLSNIQHHEHDHQHKLIELIWFISWNKFCGSHSNKQQVSTLPSIRNKPSLLYTLCCLVCPSKVLKPLNDSEGSSRSVWFSSSSANFASIWHWNLQYQSSPIASLCVVLLYRPYYFFIIDCSWAIIQLHYVCKSYSLPCCFPVWLNIFYVQSNLNNANWG